MVRETDDSIRSGIAFSLFCWLTIIFVVTSLTNKDSSMETSGFNTHIVRANPQTGKDTKKPLRREALGIHPSAYSLIVIR